MALYAQAAFPYQKLAQKLRSRILAEQLQPGTKLNSIREMAQQEGVSTLTVSKAVTILAEEGFLVRSNRRGIYILDRGEERPRAKQVGILMPVMPNLMAGDETYRPLLSLLNKRIIGSGNRVSHHCAYWYPRGPREREYIPAEDFGNLGLDALLVVGIFNYAYFAGLTRLRLPTVVIDADATPLGLDSACFDNRAAAFELTRALLERGHREIVYVGGSLPPRVPRYRDSFDPAAVERADGYALALRKLAPQHAVRIFHASNRQPAGFQEALREALRAAPGATAVVTEDPVSASALEECRCEIAGFATGSGALGKRVVALAECDFVRLGQLAMELLQARQLAPEAPARRKCVEPPVRRA